MTSHVPTRAARLLSAAMTLAAGAGCASDSPDPCMRQVTEYLRPAWFSGEPSYRTRLPVASGLFSAPGFDKAEWMVWAVSPSAVYTVTLPIETKDGRPTGRAAACDPERTYLVIRSAGFGAPQRAYGPLSQGR